MSPGYPNLDALNRILLERYGDTLNNKEFLPPQLRDAPLTQVSRSLSLSRSLARSLSRALSLRMCACAWGVEEE